MSRDCEGAVARTLGAVLAVGLTQSREGQFSVFGFRGSVRRAAVGSLRL